MPFTQTFHGPVHNVYNVEGSLILSAESKAPDLVRELAAIRGQVEATPGLPEPTRRQAETELAKAEAEGRAPRPDGKAIKDHLDSAAKTLESASNVTERAGKLAMTLFQVGKWAAALLA